jgi:hypothetical protein
MGRAILVTLLLASALINHVNGDKVIGGGNGFCAYLMFPEWYYKDTGSTKLQIVGQQRAANPAQCAKLCIAHQMASSYDEGCRTFNFWPDQRYIGYIFLTLLVWYSPATFLH